MSKGDHDLFWISAMPKQTESTGLRDELQQCLMQFSLEKPLILTRQLLCTVLRRFLADEFAVGDLVDWANLIEGHDQVRYEEGFEKLIANILFDISSPEINGPLNTDLCQRFIEQLSLH